MTGDRGQINFDFAIGVSIVLVAVILAISFVPDVFGGVTGGLQQSDEVVADRIAENLVEERLADPAYPGSIDSGCLRALFGGLAACEFSGTVESNLGTDTRRINVTVERGGEIQCWKNDEIVAYPPTTGSCTQDLFGGNDPANAEQIGTARRAISVEGEQVELVVRVW